MANAPFELRTLNYLGSKLRLLGFIDSNIKKITGKDSAVCDLFAGSGCVAYKLSATYPVVACDIQHYSTIICKALLNPYDVTSQEIESLLRYLEDGDNDELKSLFMPLITLEEEAIESNNINILAEIIERGSLEVHSREPNATRIQQQLEAVNSDIKIREWLLPGSIMSRYYGGVYFSYRQAVSIDKIINGIRKLVRRENRDVFMAALLSTVSDIASTVGKHFAQPLKARDSSGQIKPIVYTKAIKDKTLEVEKLYKEWLMVYLKLPKNKQCNIIIEGDFADCIADLPDNVRTIYADPPYTRDHYSRFYHVLETVARGDEPILSKTKIRGEEHISNGIYRNDRYQSPFCIRSKAPEAFNKMFKKASEKGINLMLSYSPYDESQKSHPRVVRMAQLLEWAEKYYKKVELVSAGYFSHSKLTSSNLFLNASDEAELLIVCKN